MLTCTLTSNQTLFFSFFQTTWGTFCSIFPACLTLTPTPWDLTTQMPNSGILYALPNMVMLFNCLTFPKVTTFTCSFGAFDVNVSVFNMSFSGVDVRGLSLVKAAEGADRHHQSILSRPSVVFPVCHSFFDPPGLINEPTVYPTGHRITVPADLWRDVPVRSKGSLTSPAALKQEKTT